MHGIPGMYTPEPHPCLKSGYRYYSREGGVYGLSVVACKSSFRPSRSLADGIYSADVSQCPCRLEDASR
jgi:hypothetical protein